MPFTLAHPAAVLPLIRRPLVASALVAGTVAPDLLYFDPIYRFATQEINGNFTITLTHKFSSALWLGSRGSSGRGRGWLGCEPRPAVRQHGRRLPGSRRLALLLVPPYDGSSGHSR